VRDVIIKEARDRLWCDCIMQSPHRRHDVRGGVRRTPATAPLRPKPHPRSRQRRRAHRGPHESPTPSTTVAAAAPIAVAAQPRRGV